MSEAMWIALFTAIPTFIAALTAMIVAIKTNSKVELVHLATNSMKDDLVAATKAAALLQGREEGVAAGAEQQAVALTDERAAGAQRQAVALTDERKAGAQRLVDATIRPKRDTLVGGSKGEKNG